MFAIQKPVVCLRKEPEELYPADFSHHPNRLTQLLWGEPCRLIERKDSYCLIEALWQPHHTDERGWHGYRGYVHEDEIAPLTTSLPPTHCIPFHSTLSYGTLLHIPEGRPLTYTLCPDTLVEDALLFLGAPYLWGGCASPSSHPSSVDCSGLIHLLFRAQGFIIPRDAHPQTLQGKCIDRHALQKGDLLYLRKKERHTHVLLFTGKEFIEAPQTGERVRVAPIREENGQIIIAGREGSYFPTYITFRGRCNNPVFAQRSS